MTYPPGYNGPPDPHLSLKQAGDGKWRCVDCGKIGSFNDLMYQAGCTARHDPCPYCGYAPVCSIDCSGIAEILSDPKVYLAGFPPEADQ